MRSLSIKAAVYLLVAPSLFACSGGDTTSLTSEDAVDTSYTPVSESSVVDTLQWKDTTVKFINANGDEQRPSIVILRQGEMTEGDPLAKLEEQAGMIVTAAELWRTITGREDVPEVLASNHVLVAEQEGRTTNYLDLDLDALTTRKVISSTALHNIFPFIDSTHCWLAIRGKQASIGNGFGHPSAYACTSANPSTDQTDANFVHFAPVTLNAACPTSFNTTSTIRAGVESGSIPGQAQTELEQTCYDGGSGWQCLDSLFIPVGGRIIADFQADASHPHRMGVGVTDTDQVHDTIVSFGAGRKIGAPPISSTNGFCR